MRFQLSFAVLALVISLATQAETDPRIVRVTLDTSLIYGFPGFLALDFTDGDGQENNSVVVSDFLTDSVVGALSLSGDASGDLIAYSLVLADSEFYNSAMQSLVFGETISFDLSLSTNDLSGPTPDSFSLFVLDSTQAPVPTNDPTGADALMVLDLTGPALDPQVFQSEFVQVSIAGDFELAAVEAEPDILWPPNNKMIPVELTVETSGADIPDTACLVSGVGANEPLDQEDVLITGPLSLELRASRLGTSPDGRIYAIEVSCIAQGLEASAVAEVRVPRDLRP